MGKQSQALPKPLLLCCHSALNVRGLLKSPMLPGVAWRGAAMAAPAVLCAWLVVPACWLRNVSPPPLRPAERWCCSQHARCCPGVAWVPFSPPYKALAGSWLGRLLPPPSYRWMGKPTKGQDTLFAVLQKLAYSMAHRKPRLTPWGAYP